MGVNLNAHRGNSLPSASTKNGRWRLALIPFFLIALLTATFTLPHGSRAAQAPTTRGNANQNAVINFTDLANRERLAPTIRRPLAIHEPLEDSEEFENKAIPAGANTTSDENNASAPLGITAVSPALASSFLALDDDNTRIPSDTHGTVGPNHLMVALNS